MDTKWLTDVAFFLASLLSLGAGGVHVARKIEYEIKKETLVTIQKGLPKLEPFTRVLTRK